MVLPILVVLVAAAPVKLAAPSLQAVGIDAAKANFLSEYLAQQLAGNGVRVTTSSEIATLIGIERQRQLMTCADTADSCMAELAGALGVDGVITGSLAKTETGSYVVAVKIVNARDGAQLALASGRFKNEDAVVDFFTAEAPRLAREVTFALRPDAQPPAVTEAPPQVDTSSAASEPKSKRWVPLAVGSALVAGGAVSYFLAQGDASRLSKGDSSITAGNQLKDAVRSGQRKETAGFFLLGAGLGAAASGAALMGDAPRNRAFIPIAAGGAVVIGGAALVGLASADAARIRDGDNGIIDSSALSGAIRAGRTKEVVGYGLLGLGFGALVTGGVSYLLGTAAPASAGLEVSSTGAALSLTGTLP